MSYQYNLGRYRWQKGKIYRRGWLFYRCIDKGPYTYLEGVKQVHVHCAIEPWRGMLP